MKLTNRETGCILIEFREDTPVFHARFLEDSLRAEGILIPPIMRSEFGGKDVVNIEDPQFKRAFIEIYWPMYMAGYSSPYEWQE